MGPWCCRKIQSRGVSLYEFCNIFINKSLEIFIFGVLFYKPMPPIVCISLQSDMKEFFSGKDFYCRLQWRSVGTSRCWHFYLLLKLQTYEIMLKIDEKNYETLLKIDENFKKSCWKKWYRFEMILINDVAFI